MKDYVGDAGTFDLALQEEYAGRVRAHVQAKAGRRGRPEKVYIGTFGCQQNEADSERLMGWAVRMGYEKTDSVTDADLIVFNTCAVREHAELRALSKTGQLKHLKAADPERIIGLWGCMVEQEHRKETIKNSYPYVDFVAGTNMLHRFPEILCDVMETGRRRYYVGQTETELVEGVDAVRESDIKAWVSVMYGCNNFCTYCVVPYVRGRERSRRPDDILREVRDLAAKGYKDITLLGQNVNSYGKTLPENERMSFAELLEKVCAVEGDFTVRFMTSHPKDVSDDLIRVIAENPKVERHFHLPLQSGNDEILHAMNRHYTREQYDTVAEKLRAAVPDILLTTDIIVGFPGETDEQFEDTLDAVKKNGFDSVFAFIFSPRQGTPAASMEDKTTREEKNARFAKLLELEMSINASHNAALVGKTLRVLCDTHPDAEGVSSGRSSGGKTMRFATESDRYGEYLNVRIDKASGASLTATVVDGE